MLSVGFPAASDVLLSAAPEDLQTQGDVIDPTQWVNAEEASKQRWIEHGQRLLIWVIISLKDLAKKSKKKCWVHEDRDETLFR